MFRIGEIAAQSGTKAYGELTIAEFSDGKPLYIPVAMVNGVKHSPILAVSAGCHGSDFNCIEAVRRVLKRVNPKTLKGVLVAVPIMNMAGFIAKNIDGADMFNEHTSLFTAFPGNAEGLIEERIADVMFREIISKADVYVDLMNPGPGTRYFSPLVNTYMHDATPEMIKRVIGIAKAFGTKIITDTRKMPWVKGHRAASEATAKGIPAIHSIGGEGEGKKITEEYVEGHVRGITNIMKHLKMVDGKPEVPREQHIFTSVRRARARQGGFLRVRVEPGQHVSRRRVLAEVTDLYYEVKEQIVSPVDGWVTFIATSATISSGDVVVEIGDEELKWTGE
jgi:predicted deacylase